MTRAPATTRQAARRAPAGAVGAVPPLAGYSVAIASDRRRHPLADLLESVGARTVGIQAARSVAKPDEARLRAATTACLAHPLHEVVISSALGLRAWLAAARRWGQADSLLARFAGARLLARDAAAADGLRALGLTTIFSTEGETTEELLRYLMAQPLAGRRIAVHTDRLSLSEVCAALRDQGAQVVEVPTFTPAPPAESYSLRRLGDLLIRRQVDALALIGAFPAEQLRAQAEQEHRWPELLAALRSDVLGLALSPRSAAPLAEAGAAIQLADRPYVEELAERTLLALPDRALRLVAGGYRLELRGQAVVLDGRFIPLPGGPLAVLRALANEPGRVLSAAEIRARSPEWTDVDDHAVEMAVSRLRRALAGAPLVQTIVRRGYQLIGGSDPT